MSPFLALLLTQIAAPTGAQGASTGAVTLVPYAQRIELMTVDEQPGEELGARCKRIAGSRIDPRPGIGLFPDASGVDEAARYTSAPITTTHPFRDLLVSWNVVCLPLTGVQVELRVATDASAEWSPWMYVGDWGDVELAPRTVKCEGGKIDTDFFRGERSFARAQVRVTAFEAPTPDKVKIVVRSLSCCASDPRSKVPWAPARAQSSSAPSEEQDAWKQRLNVPFRSQRSESSDIAGRICSPTSVSMLLARGGIDKPTREVADRAWDPVHEIYGNWPRNVQAAYSFGMRGYLTRFVCWRDVELAIADGQPIIASIAAKEGELAGAPYKKTDGHLLVVTGFDANGDVCVNDPAAKDAKAGQTVYKRSEMQTVWLDRGGTAYVLLLAP